MASYTEDEILAQLDAASEDFDFPDLNNGSAVSLAVRMHAFRDDQRWALIVETAVYNYRAASVMDVIHVFGNCITGPPGPGDDDGYLDRVANTEELQDAAEDGGVTDPVVVLGDHRIGVSGTFTDPEVLFHAFGDVHGHLLLASEGELRQRIPADLPRLFTVDEWYHPDLVDEGPSASPTFQMIAAALVSGDPARYAPAEAPNTHWKNWPFAGRM